MHDQRVVGRPVDPRVGVGTALGEHEDGGVVERSAGDADVERGVQQLGQGTVGLGALEGEVERRDARGVDLDVDELDGAARGGALPHPGPVVGDRHPRVVALDPRHVQRPAARVGEGVRGRSTGIQWAKSAPVA